MIQEIATPVCALVRNDNENGWLTVESWVWVSFRGLRLCAGCAIIIENYYEEVYL